jgi:hypothetical protein
LIIGELLVDGSFLFTQAGYMMVLFTDSMYSESLLFHHLQVPVFASGAL